VTRRKHHRVFAGWHAFAELPEKEFADKAPGVAAAITAGNEPNQPANPIIAKALRANPPASPREMAHRYTYILKVPDKSWAEAVEQTCGAQSKPARPLDALGEEELRQAVYGPGGPLHVPQKETEEFVLDNKSLEQLRRLRKELEEFKTTAPGAPL